MGLTVRELCANQTGLNQAGLNQAGFWFALTVKHQHERSVAGALASHGVDTFVPLYCARRRWSDRVKELDAPLFPGYVFGRFGDGDRVRVLRTPGVGRIVGFGGSPAPSRRVSWRRSGRRSRLSCRSGRGRTLSRATGCASRADLYAGSRALCCARKTPCAWC